jgi:hypothetical protein
MNKSEFERINSEYIDSMKMVRFSEIVLSKSQTTIEELTELIEYFKEKEDYKFCKHLKIRLDELMDN